MSDPVSTGQADGPDAGQRDFALSLVKHYIEDGRTLACVESTCKGCRDPQNVNDNIWQRICAKEGVRRCPSPEPVTWRRAYARHHQWLHALDTGTWNAVVLCPDVHPLAHCGCILPTRTREQQQQLQQQRRQRRQQQRQQRRNGDGARKELGNGDGAREEGGQQQWQHQQHQQRQQLGNGDRAREEGGQRQQQGVVEEGYHLLTLVVDPSRAALLDGAWHCVWQTPLHPANGANTWDSEHSSKRDHRLQRQGRCLARQVAAQVRGPEAAMGLAAYGGGGEGGGGGGRISGAGGGGGGGGGGGMPRRYLARVVMHVNKETPVQCSRAVMAAEAAQRLLIEALLGELAPLLHCVRRVSILGVREGICCREYEGLWEEGSAVDLVCNALQTICDAVRGEGDPDASCLKRIEVRGVEPVPPAWRQPLSRYQQEQQGPQALPQLAWGDLTMTACALEVVDVSCTAIGPEVFTMLCDRLPALTELRCSGCGLLVFQDDNTSARASLDWALRALTKLTRLQVLDVSHTPFAAQLAAWMRPDRIQSLPRLMPPRLRHLDLTCDPTDLPRQGSIGFKVYPGAMADILARCRRLRSFGALPMLKPPPPLLPHLPASALLKQAVGGGSGSPRGAVAGVVGGGFRELRVGWGVGRLQLHAWAAASSGLQHLSIGVGAAFGDSDCDVVSRCCPLLTSLQVVMAPLTDAGLAPLLRNCRQLSALALLNCTGPFTDAAVVEEEGEGLVERQEMATATSVGEGALEGQSLAAATSAGEGTVAPSDSGSVIGGGSSRSGGGAMNGGRRSDGGVVSSGSGAEKLGSSSRGCSSSSSAPRTLSHRKRPKLRELRLVNGAERMTDKGLLALVGVGGVGTEAGAGATAGGGEVGMEAAAGATAGGRMQGKAGGGREGGGRGSCTSGVSGAGLNRLELVGLPLLTRRAAVGLAEAHGGTLSRLRLEGCGHLDGPCFWQQELLPRCRLLQRLTMWHSGWYQGDALVREMAETCPALACLSLCRCDARNPLDDAAAAAGGGDPGPSLLAAASVASNTAGNAHSSGAAHQSRSVAEQQSAEQNLAYSDLRQVCVRKCAAVKPVLQVPQSVASAADTGRGSGGGVDAATAFGYGAARRAGAPVGKYTPYPYPVPCERVDGTSAGARGRFLVPFARPQQNPRDLRQRQCIDCNHWLADAKFGVVTGIAFTATLQKQWV